jgi:hypothetical protein
MVSRFLYYLIATGILVSWTTSSPIETDVLVRTIDDGRCPCPAGRMPPPSFLLRIIHT